MIEALLASTILAMAVTAILMPFTAGAQNEQADARRTVAGMLAQEMLEEIVSKPFYDPDGYSEPGPEPGEISRDFFDNMDDYHGYSEPPGSILSFDSDAATDPAAADLSRHVEVAYVHVSGQSADEDPTFVQIRVEVRHGGNPLVRLTRLVYHLP